MALLVFMGMAHLSSAERPNILIIFTDDQGYADLACYGNKKNKTPRMDQLAKEGTRFTSFYAQSVCGPSRSALLTGRYPFRSKGWGMPASEITFAELIRKTGYQTACIGKWDVSNRKPIIDRMPNAQGFDYYFGTLGANDGGGVAFHKDNEPAGKTRDMGSLTRLYTDKAIDFLENRRDKKKPFVLYIAHTMMHTIIDASERFRGKSAGGLYGVSLGGLFAGESMFHRRTDASKVALIGLVELLGTGGDRLVDVQWATAHLAGLGASEITRDDYLDRLPGLAGAVGPNWVDPAQGVAS